MDLLQELKATSSALNEAKLSYALCGGLAVAVYGHVRATTGIELLVHAKDLESVVEVLNPLGFIHPDSEIPVGREQGKSFRVQRLTKVDESDRLTVDLLIAEHEPWLAAWEQHQTCDLDGVQLSVVREFHLIQMKKIAGRPIDIDDISKLNEAKGPPDG